MKAVVVEQYATIGQIALKEIPSPRMEAGQLRILVVSLAGVPVLQGVAGH